MNIGRTHIDTDSSSYFERALRASVVLNIASTRPTTLISKDLNITQDFKEVLSNQEVLDKVLSLFKKASSELLNRQHYTKEQELLQKLWKSIQSFIRIKPFINSQKLSSSKLKRAWLYAHSPHYLKAQKIVNKPTKELTKKEIEDLLLTQFWFSLERHFLETLRHANVLSTTLSKIKLDLAERGFFIKNHQDIFLFSLDINIKELCTTEIFIAILVTQRALKLFLQYKEKALPESLALYVKNAYQVLLSLDRSTPTKNLAISNLILCLYLAEISQQCLRTVRHFIQDLWINWFLSDGFDSRTQDPLFSYFAIQRTHHIALISSSTRESRDKSLEDLKKSSFFQIISEINAPDTRKTNSRNAKQLEILRVVVQALEKEEKSVIKEHIGDFWDFHKEYYKFLSKLLDLSSDNTTFSDNAQQQLARELGDMFFSTQREIKTEEQSKFFPNQAVDLSTEVLAEYEDRFSVVNDLYRKIFDKLEDCKQVFKKDNSIRIRILEFSRCKFRSLLFLEEDRQRIITPCEFEMLLSTKDRRFAILAPLFTETEAEISLLNTDISSLQISSRGEQEKEREFDFLPNSVKQFYENRQPVRKPSTKSRSRYHRNAENTEETSHVSFIEPIDLVKNPISVVLSEPAYPPSTAPISSTVPPYDPRVSRWFNPEKDPFAFDPQYISQSHLPYAEKQWIRLIHNFGKAADEVVLEYGIPTDYLVERLDGTIKINPLYEMAAEIQLLETGEVIRGVVSICIDIQTGWIYHRYFTRKPSSIMLQEYMEKGCFELEFPDLTRAMMGDYDLKELPKPQIAEDESFICERSQLMIVIDDTKKNRCFIRLIILPKDK